MRSRVRVIGYVVAGGLLAGALGGAMSSVSAQTTVTPAALQPITIRVAIGGEVPNGVAGYRAEALCQNVPLSAVPIYRVGIDFGRGGGTGQVLVPLASTVSCAFRLTVQGTGPRPLIGNGIFVGGVGRGIFFPTVVDGVTVDASTVAETDYIPVTAPTLVIWGDAAALAASTSTTTIATTTTSSPPTTATTTTIATTTTTTRPPNPMPTAPATTQPPTTTPGSTRVIVRKVCVKVRKRACVAYRYVTVRA